MKKYIKIIFILLLIGLFMYEIFYAFKDSHDIEYVISKRINKYNVKEEFMQIGDTELYNFEIENNKNKYYFSVDREYHKKKKVIVDFIKFKDDKLECIIPTLIDNHNDRVLCNLDGDFVSISYLNQTNNNNFKKILKEINNSEYSINLNEGKKYKNYKNVKVYKNENLNDYIFTMWNYKGLSILNNNQYKNKKLLKEDKYENLYASIVGDYYVYLDTINKDFKNIYYYDFIKEKEYSMDVSEFKFDKDIYFNGVYDNKLYILNEDNKMQYLFNPDKGKIEVVGNKNIGYKFYNGKKLETISYGDFFDRDYYFGYVKNKKITKKYDTDTIYREGAYYYFLSDGKFYRTLVSDISNIEIMFEFDHVSSWIVKNRDVLFINKDTLYFYNDELGIRKIISNNEFKYNSNNICDFMKK